ncbi:hypothetical protein [Paenibacillus glucanolyticus]|uniref:hypothetical protein n=1 Tax=Paenibacillus glucanolyticus TaxID=59843 RepID=UPI00128B246A|nr:hypothetical protein [Paenibacillus glucanolyticus]MCA4751111.1 hypothetical protein [Mycolicibacterium fortuitum]MPY17494.1 hypothetical protein [Paenibacillus glucanolyticus]
MIGIFLRPLKVIFIIYFLGSLSIASDIAQLTEFNVINFIKDHSPVSGYLIIFGTFMLYIVLLIIEFSKKTNRQVSTTIEHQADQIIKTGNVNNSNIIQYKKNKEG